MDHATQVVVWLVIFPLIGLLIGITLGNRGQ